MNTEEKLYQRGRILLEQNRVRDAEQEFRRLLEINPNDDVALSLLANCQMRNPDQEKRGLETINRAISINPDISDYFVFKAFILSNLEKNKEGINAANEALALDPDDYTAFGALGACYCGLRNWKQAEMACRRALELNSDYGYAANILATTLRLQNKLDASQSKVDQLLSENPEDPYALSNAGWTALQQGDFKGAQQFFLDALRIDPCFEYARDGLLEAYKGRSPFYRGYLKYSFFMQRFSAGKQILLLIGFYFVARISARMFTGPLQIIGTGINLVYLLFVFWSWVAGGVGNFMVLQDKFARYALSPNEKKEGIFVGGAVVLGLVIFLSSLVFPSGIGMVGVAFLGAAFPLSMTFTNNHFIGRIFYGISGGIIAIGGTILSLQAAEIWNLGISEEVVKAFTGYLYLLFIATIWMGAFRVLRK